MSVSKPIKSNPIDQSVSSTRQPGISFSLGLGHHHQFVAILDAVRVQNPGVVLHLLRAEGAALVDVIEPHAVGGQTDHSRQLLLQLGHSLIQADVHLRQKVAKRGLLASATMLILIA